MSKPYTNAQWRALNDKALEHSKDELLAFCAKHGVQTAGIRVNNYLANRIVAWLERMDYAYEIAESILDTPTSWMMEA